MPKTGLEEGSLSPKTIKERKNGNREGLSEPENHQRKEKRE
jgi:hypothetical protein